MAVGVKLEWLEDLLAVIDHGSLSKAATARHLTQPAFSRRVRALENYLDCELYDRNRKPLQLTRSVQELEPAIRDCVTRLHELSNSLGQSARAELLLVIACQHSISTAIAPPMISQLSANLDARIRLRSANRDECLTMVLTAEAGVALVYRLGDSESISMPRFIDSRFVDSIVVGQDELIPVIATSALPQVRRDKRNRELSIIAYPEDVYLGQLFRQKLLPSLAQQFQLRWIAETGLTTAAAEFARSGAGIAWVPRSLAKAHLDSGQLALADRNLPRISLDICLLKPGQTSTPEVTALQTWLMQNHLPLNA